MNNVIELKPKEDNRGYLMTDKKVTGVYVENIAAMIEFDNVYLGTKGDDEINDALLTSMKDINEFCLMWLLIFDPDVIKEDMND